MPRKKQSTKKSKNNRNLNNDRDEFNFNPKFLSESGRELGQQLSDTEEFAMKGVIITLATKIIFFLPKIFQWFNTEEFHTLLNKNKASSTSEEEEIEAFKLLIDHFPNWYEDIDVSALFKEEEQMRFVGYLLFAVYAYLDVYLEKLSNALFYDIIQNPAKYSKLFDGDIKDILSKIIRVENKGVNERLNSILKILNLNTLFRTQFREKNLENIDLCFNKIIKFRHAIAHKMPFPSMTILENPEFEPLRQYVEDQLESIDTMSFEGIPEGLKDVFVHILTVFINNMRTLALIQAIPNVISIYLENFEEILIKNINLAY